PGQNQHEFLEPITARSLPAKAADPAFIPRADAEQSLQSADLLPSHGLEGAADAAERDDQAAVLSPAGTGADGGDMDRARVVSDPVHRPECPRGSELRELAVPAEAAAPDRAEAGGSSAD